MPAGCRCSFVPYDKEANGFVWRYRASCPVEWERHPMFSAGLDEGFRLAYRNRLDFAISSQGMVLFEYGVRVPGARPRRRLESRVDL